MRRVVAVLGAGILAGVGVAVITPASSEPISGVRVPSVQAFNALDARVTELEARVDALGATPEPSPEPTPTQTAEPSPSPSPTPTVEPTPSPTPTPDPEPTTGFPTAATTGVPAGWTPTRTINGDHRVTTAGATVTDLRINGDLVIDAANVTVRRVLIVGGVINNWPGNTCRNGLTVEDTTIRRGATTTASGTPAIGDGGYTARNVLIEGTAEGFRVGGKSGGCGPVTIEDSVANIVRPDVCGDWHGDGVQGYDGAALTLRNTVLTLDETGCGGTAAFFYPDQGNTSVDIDGLIVDGGGYPFRLETPGTVRNLNVVDGSWGYGPKDVTCSKLTAWSAQIVTLDAKGQPVPVRNLTCGG